MIDGHPTQDRGPRQPILVVDIGGTGIKIGYSVDGRPHAFSAVQSTQALKDDDPVAALAGMVDAAIAASGIAPGFIVATVPGFIDKDWDRVLYAGNILGLNGRKLATELGRATGCPVFLERDAVLLLSGEVLAGAGQNSAHVLGLFFGTGIGTAYLHNGTPFRGGGWALELGLMPFRGDGRFLPGLRPDCLETYCSGRVLQDIAIRHGMEVGTIFRAGETNPSLAEELATYVRYQAYAVGCAVAMVAPQAIVLGGGVLDMDGYPRERLSRLVEKHAPIVETGRAMDLRWAELGWTSVLHGAPLVVSERLAHHRNVPHLLPIRTVAG